MMDNDLFERIFSQLKIAESGGRHLDRNGNLITSRVGAEGITQVMPRTQTNPGFGVRPLQNRSQEEFERVGREYLQAMYREYKGDWEKALAAYNAGPGNVNRAISRAAAQGGDWKDYLPRPEETLPYIDRILGGVGVRREGSRPAPQQQAQRTEQPVPVAEESGVKPFGPIRSDIDWRSLETDPSWLDASELMYRAMNGRPPQEEFKTDRELAEWGLQFMADMNWSLITLGRVSNKMLNITDQETKMGLMYMMDTFDNVDISAAGVWRGTKAFVTDPLNFIGLSTFGIGTVGKRAAQGGAKLAFREALKQSAGRAGVIAGVEGMIFAGAENTMRQGVEIGIGRRDEFSYGELAGMTALGGVVGGTVGTVFDMAAGKVVNAFRSRRVEQETLGNATQSAGQSSAGRAAGRVPPQDTANVPTLYDAVANADPQKLRGRRPEDDVLTGPVLPDGNETAVLRDSGFRLDPLKTGLRMTPQTRAAARELAYGLAEQIKNLNYREVEAVVEALRRTEMTMEEHKNLATAVQMAADDLKVERAELILKVNKGLVKGKELEEVLARQAEIERVIVPIELADEAFSSQIGSMLSNRKGGLTDLRGISVETVKQQFPELTDAQAREVYANKVLNVLLEKKADEVRAQYNPEIERLTAAGDWEGATLKMAERESAVSTAVAELAPPAGAGDELKGMSGFAQYGATFQPNMSDKFNELAISNLFSSTTLMINMVPSAMKVMIQPFLKAITSNPLEKATRIELVGNYMAMKSAFTGALRAARVAFKYEQALLTRDKARLMEGELAIKGLKGGIIRTIPRMLNATDEFLSHLAYNSYVGGKAGAQAYIEAIEKGMSPKDAQRFAKEKTKEALENAYKQHDIEARLKPIVNKGLNLGLTGKELDDWVVDQAKTFLKDIRHGTDEDGLNYVRDILYKRQFSGENMPSRAAQWVEQGIMKMPSIKWATGQLFFRTPVRVFEEGLRLTPGIQMLMPNFLSDLAGKNGALRQSVAQGQALVSLAFAGAVLTKYAEGQIVGAGPTDYRERRLRQDSDLADPYTVMDGEGNTWSYRMFDPIATPMKIMVTALEHLDRLKIREAQGEFIDADAYKRVTAQFAAGLMPIVLAISDANLLSGAVTTAKLVAGTENMEGDHNAFIKYIGERLRWLVPNTAHKLYRTSDPELRDPQTLGQVVATQLGPIAPIIEANSEILTSKSYDILGNVRTVTDIGALWNIFSEATPEERAKGRSEQELTVLREMARLGWVTGATFTFGFKHQDTGDLDLRKVRTSDGTMTLYDRWNEIYRSLDPVSALYPIVTAPMPDGTFQHKAAKVEVIQRVLREYRNAAFQMMMTEEGQLLERMINQKVREGQAKAGQWDFGRTQAAPQLPW